MSRALGSASPKLRPVATAAAFAILYFLAAALTTLLIGDGAAVLWPASGVYLGVMLLAPRHMWPALACAAGVGSLAAYLYAGSSLELSIAFAVPSSAEGLLGALLVKRIAGERFALTGLRDLVALAVGGALVANGLVALSAGAVAAQAFGASFAESWLRWWSADALGILAVAPLITAPRRPRGTRIAALACLAIGLVATASGVGDQVYSVQAFLAVLLLGSLGLAVAVNERKRLRDELGSADEQLEGKAGELGDARRRVAQLTAELAARSAELHQAERRRERLVEELRDSEAGRARAERELHAFGCELSSVKSDCGRLEADLVDAAGELARRSAENEALGEAVESLREEQARITRELSGAISDRGRTEEELDYARAEQARTSAELAEAAAGRERAEEELDFARAEQARMAQELSDAGAGRARTEEALGRAEEELEIARAEQARMAQELSEARAGRGQAEEALGRAAEELEIARVEQARMAQELSEALANRGRADEELEITRAELARIADAPAQVEGMRAELERARHAQAQAEHALEHTRARHADERERLERSLGDAAQALGSAQSERRLLGEHSTELISRYDDRGICLYASPASRRLLGYEPDELVGRAGAELLHPDDRHRLARARATRTETTFEARLRRKSGDYISVAVSLHPVWGRENGRLTGVTTVVRQVSQPHAADDDRRLASVEGWPRRLSA